MPWQWLLLEAQCTGCGICGDVCPHNAIRMTRQMPYPEAIEGNCVGCMECVAQCPFDAIKVESSAALESRFQSERRG